MFSSLIRNIMSKLWNTQFKPRYNLLVYVVATFKKNAFYHFSMNWSVLDFELVCFCNMSSFRREERKRPEYTCRCFLCLFWFIFNPLSSVNIIMCSAARVNTAATCVSDHFLGSQFSCVSDISAPLCLPTALRFYTDRLANILQQLK